MKKVIIVFAAIGFIAMAAIRTKQSFFNDKESKSTPSVVNHKNYETCIEACNNCIASCKKVEHLYKKDATMTECVKLCKECVTACSESVELMKANSIAVKSRCLECAKVCEKCATECDKYNMAECKKCANDCRTAAKLCNEMGEQY